MAEIKIRHVVLIGWILKRDEVISTYFVQISIRWAKNSTHIFEAKAVFAGVFGQLLRWLPQKISDALKYFFVTIYEQEA